MGWLAFSSRRFLGLFGVAAAVVALRNLAWPGPFPKALDGAKSAPARVLYRGSYAVLCAFVLAVLAGVLLAGPGFEGGRPGGSRAVLNPHCVCPGAAEFILAENLRGPIFNDMYLGAYLVYRLHPKHKLLIDNRDLDWPLLDSYTRALQSPQAWAALDRQYGFQTVVLGNLTPNMAEPAMVLRKLLKDSAEWRLAYVDPTAVVFTRNSEPADEGRPAARLETAGVPFLACHGVPFERVFLTLGQMLVPMDSFVLLHYYLRVLDQLDLQPDAMRIINDGQARCPRETRLQAYRDYFQRKLARRTSPGAGPR